MGGGGILYSMSSYRVYVRIIFFSEFYDHINFKEYVYLRSAFEALGKCTWNLKVSTEMIDRLLSV